MLIESNNTMKEQWRKERHQIQSTGLVTKITFSQWLHQSGKVAEFEANETQRKEYTLLLQPSKKDTNDTSQDDLYYHDHEGNRGELIPASQRQAVAAAMQSNRPLRNIQWPDDEDDDDTEIIISSSNPIDPVDPADPADRVDRVDPADLYSPYQDDDDDDDLTQGIAIQAQLALEMLERSSPPSSQPSSRPATPCPLRPPNGSLYRSIMTDLTDFRSQRQGSAIPQD